MKVRSSAASFDLVHPAAPPPEIQVEQRPGEMRRVVKHLQALIVPHVDAAKKMDRLLGAADLKAVIAALVAEADGLSPNPHAFGKSRFRAIRQAAEIFLFAIIRRPGQAAQGQLVVEGVGPF